MRSFVSAGVVAVAASCAMAQPNTGGSISDLNAAFTQGDSPLVGTGPGPIAASFQVGGAGNPDHLGASWWWTRTTAANTRELANNSATSSNWPAGGAGRVGQLSFNDPGSGISIVRTYLVTGLGDGRGVLEEGATVTNTTGSTLTVNLFHFLDPTLGGAAGGITAELNGLTNIRLTSGNFTAFYEGSGNAFQAGQAGIILSLLTNGVADNFTSGPMPPPGDIEAGFQWQFVLGPGQAASASMTYTVVPTPGSLALLGMAGAVAGRRRR